MTTTAQDLPETSTEARDGGVESMRLLGYIGPSGEHLSRRQEMLSQDARDILAWAFREGLPANSMLPIPMTAAEVKIGEGDVNRICGGGGFHKHGGSDSLRYFKHAEDEEWALVFSHDCDGCPDRGAALVKTLSA